jgi:hypothetical protein
MIANKPFETVVKFKCLGTITSKKITLTKKLKAHKNRGMLFLSFSSELFYLPIFYLET